MLRQYGAFILITTGSLACAGERVSTTAPSEDRQATVSHGGTITHGIPLVATLGTGWGRVNVTPTAEDQGTFHVQGEVQVLGVPPNTTYLVQRAPDLDVADPNCTGPWISFPLPNPGPVVTLTSSPGGAGAAHFELAVGGAFTSGTPFNVRFRLINDLSAPTSVLETACTTVVVK
jgi:hypothetical protein